MGRNKIQHELSMYPDIRKIDGARIPIDVKLRDMAGVQVAFRDNKTGRIVGGKIYHKMIKCGRRECRACRRGPSHGPYAYAAYRINGKVKHKYLGSAK